MVSFEGIRSLWCVHLFTISLYVANTNGYLLEQKMFSHLNNFKHSGMKVRKALELCVYLTLLGRFRSEGLLALKALLTAFSFSDRQCGQ